MFFFQIKTLKVSKMVSEHFSNIKIIANNEDILSDEK